MNAHRNALIRAASRLRICRVVALLVFCLAVPHTYRKHLGEGMMGQASCPSGTLMFWGFGLGLALHGGPQEAGGAYLNRYLYFDFSNFSSRFALASHAINWSHNIYIFGFSVCCGPHLHLNTSHAGSRSSERIGCNSLLMDSSM